MSSTFEYDSWKSLAILVQSSVNAHSPWRIGRKTAEAVADDIIAAGWTEAATQSAAVQVNAPDLSWDRAHADTRNRP